MTTGFGFVSEKGKEGILVTDRQGSSLDGRFKTPCKKIQINYDANFAFTVAGRLDEHYEKMASRLMSGDIDVERIVKTGRFNELKNINLKRWGGRLPDMEVCNSLLFLTNFGDKKQLYTAWPLGRVEERITTWIGSGSNQVGAYMNSKDTTMYAETGVKLLGNDDIPSEQARGLVYTGLKLAAKHDMYSSGIDMVVMNEDGIRNVSDDFSDLEKRFDKATYDIIMKK